MRPLAKTMLEAFLTHIIEYSNRNHIESDPRRGYIELFIQGVKSEIEVFIDKHLK